MANAIGPLNFQNGYNPPRNVNNDGLPRPNSIWERQSSLKKITVAIPIFSGLLAAAGVALIVLSSVKTPIKLPTLVNIPGAVGVTLSLSGIPIAIHFSKLSKRQFWSDDEYIRSQRELVPNMTLEQLLVYFPKNRLLNDHVLSRYDLVVKVHEYIERNNYSYSEAIRALRVIDREDFVINYVGMGLEKFAIAEIDIKCKNNDGNICPRKINACFNEIPNPIVRGVISWRLYEKDFKVAIMQYTSQDIDIYIKGTVPNDIILNILNEKFRNISFKEAVKSFDWNWIDANCPQEIKANLIKNEFKASSIAYNQIQQHFGQVDIYKYISRNDPVLEESVVRMLLSNKFTDLVIKYGEEILNIVKLCPKIVQDVVIDTFEVIKKTCIGWGFKQALKKDSRDIKVLVKTYIKDCNPQNLVLKQKLDEIYTVRKINFNPKDPSNMIDEVVPSEIVDGPVATKVEMARASRRNGKAKIRQPLKNGSAQ